MPESVTSWIGTDLAAVEAFWEAAGMAEEVAIGRRTRSRPARRDNA